MPSLIRSWFLAARNPHQTPFHVGAEFRSCPMASPSRRTGNTTCRSPSNARTQVAVLGHLGEHVDQADRCVGSGEQHEPGVRSRVANVRCSSACSSSPCRSWFPRPGNRVSANAGSMVASTARVGAQNRSSTAPRASQRPVGGRGDIVGGVEVAPVVRAALQRWAAARGGPRGHHVGHAHVEVAA